MILDFRILLGWIEKYKPALSKSASFSKDLYYVRLIISSVKQCKLVQFFTRNFQIFKKVYLQILKTFIYTTKITKTPFNTKK